jgi:hypothetical protein
MTNPALKCRAIFKCSFGTTKCLGKYFIGTAEIYFHKYRSSYSIRCFQPSLRDVGNSEFTLALKCRAIVIASLRDGQTLLAALVHPKMISHCQQLAAGGLKFLQASF